MEIDKIEEEFYENGNRKINIGVKTLPEIKLNLAEQARQIGITLSEHCENILSNHSSLLSEIDDLRIRVEELNSIIKGLRKELETNNDTKYKNENEVLKREKTLLANKVTELNSNLGIYTDTRLLNLFSRVKGKKDVISTDNGEMHIIFNSPKDLLLALIYSYTL